MKNFYIKDLKKGNSLFGEDFALRVMTKATKKDGSPYLKLELSDKTGTINGNMWSPTADLTEKLEGKIISVDANIELFNDQLQLNISKISEVTNPDIVNFMPASEFNQDEMWLEVEENIKNIKNKHLKLILASIFTPEIIIMFKNSAAGLKVHHGYVGGLLEHTLEMLRLSKELLHTYPNLNNDILATGILLHDIGKIYEYDTGIMTKMTTKGQLLGHIVIGAEMIKDLAPKSTPNDLLDELIHIIISHHGAVEFGSPVMPSTPEALATAMLDNVSAKVNASYYAIRNLGEGAEFSSYHRQLKTSLYRSPYLNELVNEDIPF